MTSITRLNGADYNYPKCQCPERLIHVYRVAYNLGRLFRAREDNYFRLGTVAVIVDGTMVEYNRGKL